MDCKESRRTFYNEALAQGWLKVDQVPASFMAEVPEELKSKWLRLLSKNFKPKLQETPRLLNHFTLGADPEFVLYNPLDGARLDGAALGLRTGQAFGVDSNGRLLEIRPMPTRWALELLASTLVTMRWLALVHPETIVYEWRAGAFLLRDGLGGHVHVGRKAASRKEEVSALDVLNDMLTTLGVYPAQEIAARKAGDQFGQRYGMPGDIRLQSHGYEYRTFPSWLDSPWTAYLSLVLSKLLVYDPDVFKEFKLNAPPKLSQQRIASLLAKWQGLDDDAALALHTLRMKGFPTHIGADFKGRWGLRYPVDSGAVKIDVVPKQIQPSKDEILQVFCHLVRGTELMPDVPQAYWVTKLPKGYRTILSYTETQRIPGLGEILNELVVHEKMTMTFHPAENGSSHIVKISTGLLKKLSKDWPKIAGLKTYGIDPTNNFRISLGLEARGLKNSGRMRGALISGAFPIWEAGKLEADSFEKWEAGVAGVGEVKTVAKVLVKKE